SDRGPLARGPHPPPPVSTAPQRLPTAARCSPRPPVPLQVLHHAFVVLVEHAVDVVHGVLFPVGFAAGEPVAEGVVAAAAAVLGELAEGDGAVQPLPER